MKPGPVIALGVLIVASDSWRAIVHLEFEDGARIEHDARGDDPLIYCLPPAGWSQAVGFLALPKYQEHTATTVTLQVYASHEARLADRKDAELRLLVGRLAGALIRLLSHWRELRVDWPAWLFSRLGVRTIVDLYQAAGWQARPAGADPPLLFVR